MSDKKYLDANGIEIPYDMLEESAKAANMSVEDYYASISKKPKDPNIDKINNIKKNFGNTEDPKPDQISSEIELTDDDNEKVLDYMEELNPRFDKKTFKVNQKKSEYLNIIEDQSKKIYNDQFKKSEDKTKYGTLDYDNEESIAEFREKAIFDFTSNNPTIKNTILPKIEKKYEEDLQAYITEAKDKYKLNNSEEVTQENIDAFYKDVNNYYSKTINNALLADNDFLGLVQGFEQHLGDQMAADQQQFTVNKATPDWWKATKAFAYSSPLLSENLVEFLEQSYFVGGARINTQAKQLGTAGLVKETADKVKRFEHSKELANKHNWSDETEGYWIKDETNKANAYIFTPKFQKDIGNASDGQIIKPGGAIEGTWGQFQSEYKEEITNRVDKAQTNMVDILERQVEAQAFNQDSFDKLIAGEDRGRNIARLMGEQLPQMGAALLTLGASASMQIGGDIYWEMIQGEAKKIREEKLSKEPDKEKRKILAQQIEEPVSAEEMLEVLKDDKFNDKAEKRAVVGGFIGGQLERFGAGKALKPFVTKGTTSILRGGAKNFLKNVVNKGVANTKNGFEEAITEVLQETVQSVATDQIPDGKNLVKAGGTGFVVGTAFGFAGNVSQQSATELQTINSVIAGKLNPKSSEAYYNTKIKEIDGLIDQVTDDDQRLFELENKRKVIINARNANNKIPSNFTGASKQKAFDLIVEKQELQEQIEGKEKALVQNETQRISEINSQLGNLYATEIITQKAIKAGKVLDDVKIEVAENSDQAQNLAGKNSVALDNNATGLISEDGKTIIIDKQKAAELGEVNTASHELLHAVLFKTLFETDKDGNVRGKNVVRGLAAALDKKLAQLNPETIKNSEFAARLKLYKNDPSSIRAEEKLTLFADALFYGDIKFNEGLLTQIQDFIRRLLQNAGFKNISFNNEQDVYNFLKDYNRAIQKGKLGKGITKVAKEGAQVGEDIRRFQGPEAVPSARKNLSKAEFKNTVEKLNGLKDGNKTIDLTTKPEVFEALPTMIDVQVKNLAATFDNDTREELISDIQERILRPNQEGNNPDLTFKGIGQVYGFLNDRIRKRLLDALKADRKSISPQYLNRLEGNAIEKLEKQTTEDGPAPKQQEKPTYKTISKSNIFSTSALDQIKNKLVSTVRVLKSKINAPTTINQTVKPIISEIKTEMGKQADIIIKKDAGGLQNNRLEKVFLKSKKATLENAPTTWLAKAMPFAVQKSVGGKYTGEFVIDPVTNKKVEVFEPNFINDWKGKKIDRVKTLGTGQTSGNQIVRRKPNVAQKVTDEQYMGYMFKFDNDGNATEIIRGRKESWSKMMAEEVSFELIDDALNDLKSPISKELIKNQERLGVEVSENFAQQVRKDIDRGNVKFNRVGLPKLNAQKFQAWFDNRQLFFDGIAALKGNYTLNKIQSIHEEVYDDAYTEQEHKQIAKQFFNELKRFKGKDIETQLDADGLTLDEYLADIALTQDLNENIVKLTGASNSVQKLYEDKGNIIEAQQIVIDAFAGLDIQTAVAFAGGTFANSGRIGRFIGNKIDNTKTHRSDLFVGKKGIIKALNKAGFNIKDITNSEIILNNGKVLKRQYSATGNVIKKHLGDFDITNEIKNANAAWDFTTSIMKSIKNANPDVQAMVMAAMNSGTNTSLRVAAPVTHRSSVLPSTNTKDYRYEHAVPARVVLAFMYHGIINNDPEVNLKALKEDYQVAIIPKEMDSVLGKVKLGQTMMAGYRPGLTPWWTRYYNFLTRGKVQYALQSYKTGNIVGQTYADVYNDNIGQVKEVGAPVVKKSKASRSLNKDINEMISRQKGVRPETTYSEVVARKRGARKGRLDFFLPASAEDFRGLTSYTFAGKGKQGEADQKFFEDNLISPYVSGVAAMEKARQALKNDFKGLNRLFPKVRKALNKEIDKTGFTLDQAVRVYLYDKSGFEVEGISKRDKKFLIDTINNNEDYRGYADGLQAISKKEKWAEPDPYWDAGSILKDLNTLDEKVSRKEYLSEFIQNVDEIFDKPTLSKIEALYGTKHREALEDIIRRMKSGSNRPGQGDRLTNTWLNWVNNSVGTIMFFNRRSALLQMISFANFTNWSDNNPIKAATAFANQPAYWKAWVEIFNSPKLKQRRGGLKSDVQEQEIANQAKNSPNKVQAAISYLLKIGFTPTQIADSVAIATGGATFLINRTKTYQKQGMSYEDARAKAFEDFTKISDETQQSGDPMLISKQQSSHLGRLILSFQNTPMQYTRLMKKAAQDLVNGRGDWRTNVSKIMYYGFIQNLIFATLQQAAFALLPGFEPEEDEEEFQEDVNQKQIKILNSMIDTILRGSGLAGAVVSTLKNAIRRYQFEDAKGFTADHAYTLLELANISPPIGSKLRKVYNAIQTKKFDADVLEARGLAFDSPAYEIIGNLASAGANIPLDRALAEVRAITEALDSRNTAMQRMALALGWRTWDVNIKNEEHQLIKTEAKARRKEEGIQKAKETRKRNAELKKEILLKLSKENNKEYKRYKKLSTKEKNEYIKKEIEKLNK